MKKKETINTAEWYREYIDCCGIHSREEFERFSGILTGILVTRYGEEILEDPGKINFGDLIGSDTSFNYWVEYTGSIKEAKIYIRSLLNTAGRGDP
jgi:hypothetical protein